MELEMLNVRRNFAVFKNGVILPITDYFDDEGEPCEGDVAVACVAGSDEFGWLDIEIYPPSCKVTLH